MIEILHHISVALPVTLSAIGAGIGQGLIGKSAIQAIYQQPKSANEISKLCIVGTALTETASILGAVTSLILLLDKTPVQDYYYATFGKIAIALAVGIPGFFVGIASALPSQAASQSLARQPFAQTQILNLMLITQTLIMTPQIFGFLIALLIKAKIASLTNTVQALQVIAGGLSIGIGSIGPTIGLSLFAYAACKSVGINRKAYGKILTFTFISEAIIETPLIFALLVALSVLTSPITQATPIIKGISFIAAGICIGISTIAPGISSGKTGAASCNQIALHLEQYPAVSKVTMLALAMIDTFAIYGLLTSMVLIFIT